jgi:hypothetical protein
MVGMVLDDLSAGCNQNETEVPRNLLNRDTIDHA